MLPLYCLDYQLNNILYYKRHPNGCNMNRTAVIKNLIALLTLSLFAFNCCSVNITAAQKSDGNEDQLFATSFQDVVDKAVLVTHDHDIQIQKWKRGEHNNNTMASITDWGTWVPAGPSRWTIGRPLTIRFRDGNWLLMLAFIEEGGLI